MSVKLKVNFITRRVKQPITHPLSVCHYVSYIKTWQPTPGKKIKNKKHCQENHQEDMTEIVNERERERI